jgi:hypothetical protein
MTLLTRLRTGEVLRVHAIDGEVELSSEGRWTVSLAREEAWDLAEAIDEVATAAAAE